ncbi:MAG: NADH-quinone oxidoreductase subunit M [Candidatus Eiseniibacteriota bacterium]|nr:MAG: NADH-quinone oxidoreductase subunit M [Candidatus Eisenbacteria bacterium]
MSQVPLITVVTFLPLLGAFLIALTNPGRVRFIRTVALVTALVDFAVCVPLLAGFDVSTPSVQFVEKHAWIDAIGSSYHVGIDGISLFLVILTSFLTVLSIGASWTSITHRVKGFMVSMLILETGMIGVFVSLDLLLFYIFWEAMLIPMYLIIGVWGGPQRIYAAVKFILYTLAGSLLMLVAILALFFIHHGNTGEYTFDLLKLYGTAIPGGVELWLFLAFFLSFAIKVPMFPFHTWLPDAHVEAPTAGSVLLAGILLKMGTYGFLRFCLPLFPRVSLQAVPAIAILAIIGIIYGALVALAQRDVKKLVAYSSVSHLGFVMLGLFALNTQGVEGGILQMVNHGISTGALFLIVGMLYDRRHSRMMEDFGGLWKRMPVFAGFFLIVTLSSIALPGLNGFAGEFLILVGAFMKNAVFAAAAAVGIILSAVYMLWMFQKVMFGEPRDGDGEEQSAAQKHGSVFFDIGARERWILVPIVVLIFWIGVWPGFFLSRMHASVDALLETVRNANAAPVESVEEAASRGLPTLTRQLMHGGEEDSEGASQGASQEVASAMEPDTQADEGGE